MDLLLMPNPMEFRHPDTFLHNTEKVIFSNASDDDGNIRKADVECGSEDENEDFWCTHLDSIDFEETDYEQEVGKIHSEMEESSDTMSDVYAKASKQKITNEEVSDSELTRCLASKASDDDGNNRKASMEYGSEDDSGDFWCNYLVGLDLEETDNEQEVGEIESEMEESSDTKADLEYGSEDDSGDFWCTYLEGLDFEETNDEQEVAKIESEVEESSDTMSDLARNWWSEDESGSDQDYLYDDDLFSKGTDNEHEVLADDQEATTSLEGYDIQCSKIVEEKIVAYVHQAGPQKQIGVKNTLSNVVNVRTDEDFSSTTSAVSFQMAPKYQLKEENIPQVGHETRTLAILRLDLSPVRATDLFGRMSCFLPKGGKIMSVCVYTTEKRGPVGFFDDEIDKVQTLASEESRERYYGVVECDSIDTAKFVYDDFTKIFSRIGVTRQMLELRFIPDAMEFKDNLRDSATERPTTYEGPDLVHLLSREDLKEIGVVVTKPERPERPEGFSMNQMWDDLGLDESLNTTDDDEEDALDYTNPQCGDPFARKTAFPDVKLSCGTTIVGVQLKDATGTYLAADGKATIFVPGGEHGNKIYGNIVKIHRLGEPVYMLAACAGHTLWIYPIMSHVAAMARSKEWTAENCAVYTNMFLNSKFEPNRHIWGLPSKSNIKKTTCTILFASCMQKKGVEDVEYESQLWSGDSKKTLKHGANNKNYLACYGSGGQYAKTSLECDEETLASGSLCTEEVIIKLLEAFKLASDRDECTGENILVYLITKGFDMELHNGHVDGVKEVVKILKETIEKKKAKLSEELTSK